MRGGGLASRPPCQLYGCSLRRCWIEAGNIPNMGSKAGWDYALVLKGITPRRLHMAKLAEYLREWAGLLGDANMPVLKSITQGSVELRATVREDRKLETRVRLLQAKTQPDAGA